MEETKEEPREEKQGDDPDIEAQKHILRSFFRAVQRYSGKLHDIFSGVSDPRQAGKSPIRCTFYCSLECCCLPASWGRGGKSTTNCAGMLQCERNTGPCLEWKTFRMGIH